MAKHKHKHASHDHQESSTASPVPVKKSVDGSGVCEDPHLVEARHDGTITTVNAAVVKRHQRVDCASKAFADEVVSLAASHLSADVWPQAKWVMWYCGSLHAIAAMTGTPHRHPVNSLIIGPEQDDAFLRNMYTKLMPKLSKHEQQKLDASMKKVLNTRESSRRQPKLDRHMG